MKSFNYTKLVCSGLGIFIFLFTNTNLFAQPNWPVTQTGDNHTVIVQSNIVQDINGGSLAVGDYVGVFYDNNGTMACAGKAEWTGSNISVTAFGDDNSTSTEKEGFAVGETFMWKVWVASTGEELDGTATYKPADIIISHQGSYAANGISSLESLSASGGGGGGNGPEWPVVITGDNHTVIVEASIPVDLAGESIAVGDYIGAFYDDNGTAKCAGKGEWTGSNFSIAVYGDDNTTSSVKEGFAIGETFSWKVWRAATGEEADATATYKATDQVISHTDSYASNGISGLASLTVGGGGGGPDWTVVPTSENHTIVVPSHAQSLIGDTPLANGDYVGAFYRDLNGVEACAGFGIWDGGDLVFSVYGNDLGQLGKNGYNVGENFVWKAYKASNGQTYDLIYVTYLSLNGFYTHSSQYAHNGVSGLSGLFTNVEQHAIALKSGWNLISSYINPIEPEMERVFSQQTSVINMVKNQGGNVYSPTLNINQIGSWNYLEGYVVRASSTTTLTMYGTVVDPTTSLDLPAGWSIMPYLSSTNRPISTVLASILADIIEVKDNDGNSFIPLFGIDNIQFMRPGQAYKIRMARARTLTPTARVERLAPQNWTTSTMKPVFFHNSSQATLYNATIAIPAEIAEGVMEKGDELAIYNMDGILGGSVVFEGNSLAFNVRGDDPNTAEVEGLSTGDALIAKIWKKQSDQIQSIGLSFDDRETVYYQDELMVARKLAPQGEWALNIINNPTQGTIRLHLHTPENGTANIDIYNQLGQVVKRWNSSITRGIQEVNIPAEQLPSGVYYIKLPTNDQPIVKKLVLTN